MMPRSPETRARNNEEPGKSKGQSNAGAAQSNHSGPTARRMRVRIEPHRGHLLSIAATAVPFLSPALILPGPV